MILAAHRLVAAYHSSPREVALRLLASSAPLLLALLVAKLWLTGTLGYYVNARTVWIVLAGALLFATVGVAGMIRAFTSSGARLSWRTPIFLLPILLGLVLPAHPLSSATGQASTLGNLQLAAHVSSGEPGDRFGSWIAAVADHPSPGWWTGQHVTLVGFVAREQGLSGNDFLVGRFLVTCCVVDASLLGFPVHMDSGRRPPDGAWVQATGVFGRRFWTDQAGSQWPVIEHVRLTTVNIPSSPYLSP